MLKHGFRWLVFVALLSHASALAQGSSGEPSAAVKQEAAERFERGVQLFKEQAFRAALVEFQRTYDLAPDYRLLYNLGRTKYYLQDYLGAAQNFESYLAQGGSDIPPDRRAQVEETLASLRSRVGRLSITVSREGAELFVDDVKVGTSPLASLVLTNVGRHRVSARAPDGSVSAEFVDVAGGDIADVRIAMAEPQRSFAPVASAPARDEATPRSTARKLAIASWITGGALLAAGGATGLMSLRARSDLDDQVSTLNVDQDIVGEQRTKVDTLSLTTDILIGVGAAAAVTGTVLWLVGGDRGERAAEAKSPARAQLRLNVGVDSLSLTGRF